MVDLKKSDDTKLLQSELQEISTTSQKLNGELETVRFKLNNELDLLTYKLEKTQSDIQDIRREIHEINMTINKLRYDLIDALRNGKSSENREIFSSLFPLIAITFPAFLIVIMVVATLLLS